MSFLIGKKIELKYNLDVMHIEKNICDSLLRTLLGDPHKSKDTNNARRDLEKLGIMSELHMYEDGNKLMKPNAEYSFRSKSKKFLQLRWISKISG